MHVHFHTCCSKTDLITASPFQQAFFAVGSLEYCKTCAFHVRAHVRESVGTKKKSESRIHDTSSWVSAGRYGFMAEAILFTFVQKVRSTIIQLLMRDPLTRRSPDRGTAQGRLCNVKRTIEPQQTSEWLPGTTYIADMLWWKKRISRVVVSSRRIVMKKEHALKLAEGREPRTSRSKGKVRNQSITVELKLRPGLSARKALAHNHEDPCMTFVKTVQPLFLVNTETRGAHGAICRCLCDDVARP